MSSRESISQPQTSSAHSTVQIEGYKLQDGRFVPASELPNARRDTQIEAMRGWFLTHYEDPAEYCPYDSAEGGYQYIYGGPYDAKEELFDEFGGVVDESVIDELADILSNIAPEWSGSSNEVEMDDILSPSIAELVGHADAFRESAVNIARLLEIKVEAADYQCWLRLLYVNVITALETYLADKFMSSVLGDDVLLKKFVETTPKFQKETFPLSTLFATYDGIKLRVKEYLLDEVWHRLDKVSPMFEQTLSIAFPPDMKALYLAMIIRHDCVHRNGKTKDGKERLLTEKDVHDLLFETDKLVTWIEANGMQAHL